MDPTTITIGSRDYTVYVDSDYVDGYADGAVSAGAVAWRAITDAEEKSRLIVATTRLVDRQSWAGDRAVDGQPLAFPRTGLTDLEGDTLGSDELPAEFLDGFCELVLAMAGGAEVETLATTESNVGSLKAGPVAITFWRGVSSALAARFPLSVNELFGRWLAGGRPVVGGVATGTDGESDFDDDWSIAEGL